MLHFLLFASQCLDIVPVSTLPKTRSCTRERESQTFNSKKKWLIEKHLAGDLAQWLDKPVPSKCEAEFDPWHQGKNKTKQKTSFFDHPGLFSYSLLGTCTVTTVWLVDSYRFRTGWTYKFILSKCFIIFGGVLAIGIEPRAWHTLGKCFTAELFPRPKPCFRLVVREL